MKPDEAFGLIFSWDNVIVSWYFLLVYIDVMVSDIKCFKGFLEKLARLQ
jgi:hypothetical protein